MSFLASLAKKAKQGVKDVQAVAAQVNPLDNNRTYKTVQQHGAQYAPSAPQSVGNQVFRNGAVQSFGIPQAVNTVNAARLNTGGLINALAHSGQARANIIADTNRASAYATQHGLGNAGALLTEQQAASSGGGFKGLNKNFTKPFVNAAATYAPLAIPGAGAIVGKGASLGTRAAIDGGLNTLVGAGANAAQQKVNTGKVNIKQVAGSGLLAGGSAAALPIAGAAVKKGAPIAARKTLDVATNKPHRNISDNELATATKVRSSMQGGVDPYELSSKDVQTYRGVQKKLGAGVNDHAAVDDAIGQRVTYETRKAQNIQTAKNVLQAPDRLLEKRGLQLGGSLKAVTDTAADAPTSSKPQLAVAEQALATEPLPVSNKPLPIYNTKQVGNLDKAFRSTRSIIERQGKSGEELAGMLQGARDNQEITLAQWQKQLPTVSALARKDKNRIRGGGDFENFVEATQGRATPNNAKVAQAIQEWQAFHPQVRDRAVAAGLDVGDLGPQYYPHFNDYDQIFKDQNMYNQAINHLVESGQAASVEDARKLLTYAQGVSRNREFGNLEAARVADLPFYDKSPNSLIGYLNGSSKRIAHTETFGAKDEKALKLLTKVGLEGGDHEAAKDAFDVAVGAKNYGATANKISGNIRKYTTTTRLGLGALTNVSQSINTGIVTGHLNTMQAALKQLSPKTREFAKDTGVISDALLSDMRAQQGYKSFSSKVLGNSVNKITAPGFSAVEKFNRALAATAGRDYALRLAQSGNEKALRRIGVTGEIKGNTLTEAQQIQAARKVVEKTQFKVDAQDLPGWTDSPGGKLVSQFRTFSYAQGKFVSNEIIKPIGRGDIRPAARLLASLPVGYGLYEGRRLIDGRPEEDSNVKKGLAAFGKVGGAGLAFDIYQSLNPPASKYTPSDRRVSMAAGTFGGPAVGTAVQGVGALSDLIQRKNTPEDKSTLQGKLAVADNGNTYTDVTAAARFGLSQIPVIGSPIKNRVLPYKKQDDAQTGKLALTKDQQEQLAALPDQKDRQTFLNKVSGNDKNVGKLTGVDKLKVSEKAQLAALKSSLSDEDYKLSKLSKQDRQKLIDNGSYTQAKFNGLDKYVANQKKKLGIDTQTKDTYAKGLDGPSRQVLAAYDKMDAAARDKASNTQNDFDYKYDLAKFNNDKASGKLTAIEAAMKQSELQKEAIGSKYSKEVREAYGMSKGKLASYLATASNGNELYNQLQAYDNDLKSKGVNKSLKFKYGLASGSGKGSKGRRRGSGKSGSSRVASGLPAGAKPSLTGAIASTKNVSSAVRNAKVKKGSSAKVAFTAKINKGKQYSTLTRKAA